MRLKDKVEQLRNCKVCKIPVDHKGANWLIMINEAFKNSEHLPEFDKLKIKIFFLQLILKNKAKFENKFKEILMLVIRDP